MVDAVKRGLTPSDRSPSPPDDRPSKRARERSPSPARDPMQPPTRVSSTSIAPRHRIALHHTAGQLETLVRAPLPQHDDPAALVQWRTQARTLRLQLGRIVSAIAHEDPMPPMAANQASAKLVVGSKLLRHAAQMLALPGEDRSALAAVLLKAQHQARGVHHNGLASHEVGPMTFAPDKPGIEGWTAVNYRSDGSSFVDNVSITAAADLVPSSQGTVAHESVHEAQSLPHREIVGLAGSSRDAPGRGSKALEVRPGFLATGVELPAWRPADIPAPPADHPLSQEFYLSTPRETQAFLEQSHVAIQSEDATRPMGQGMLRLLEAVIDPLVKAGRELDVASPSSGSAATPAPTLRYESTQHALAFEQVAAIVNAVVDLNTASHSRGWSPAMGARAATGVAREMKTLASLPSTGSEFTLTRLSQVMERLVDRLPSDGVHAGRPDLDAPSAGSLGQAKHDPLTQAAKALGLRTEEESDALTMTLYGSLSSSGFLQHVKALDNPHMPEARQSQAVGSAVTALAAQLLGMEARRLPALDVHLYDAPNTSIPRVEGMNLHAGQGRKMSFEFDTWQLHVPRQRLEQAQDASVAADLAKLAFNVAYAADVLRSGKLSDDAIHDLGGVVSDAVQVILRTEPDARQARQRQPQSAVAMLRRATATHASSRTLSQEGRTFHEGPRVELKTSARQRDPETARAADESYAVHSMLRWNDPGVALRRALGAMAQLMVVETSASAGEAGSSRAAF